MELTLQQQDELIKAAASGKTYDHITRELHYSNSTISKYTSRDNLLYRMGCMFRRVDQLENEIDTFKGISLILTISTLILLFINLIY